MMANYHPLVPKDDVAAQSLKTDFSANSSPHLPFQASVLFYLCSMQCYAMLAMNILLCGDCLTSVKCMAWQMVKFWCSQKHVTDLVLCVWKILEGNIHMPEDRTNMILIFLNNLSVYHISCDWQWWIFTRQWKY